MQLMVLDIVEDTTVDGPGFRTAIYAAGCPHGCPGCHNPQSWDILHGRPMTVDKLLQVVLADPFAEVTFSGGDPMWQAEGFAALARAIRVQSRKSIWCYTGYTWEAVVTHPQRKSLLEQVDVLVDGPFLQAQRDESLLFRGSANQRLIDVPASLASGHPVLWQSQAGYGLDG